MGVCELYETVRQTSSLAGVQTKMNRDMDFILGILTGVALCLAYGNYLVRKQRQQIKKQQEQQVNTLVNAWLRSRHHQHPTLDKQLQDAIEREDFKEAARLRDIINKR